jgi:hypothetical protein
MDDCSRPGLVRDSSPRPPSVSAPQRQLTNVESDDVQREPELEVREAKRSLAEVTVIYIALPPGTYPDAAFPT